MTSRIETEVTDETEEPAATAGAATPRDDHDLLEAAWNLIANASSGNWSKQSQEWQEAARRWRSRYFDLTPPVPETPDMEAAMVAGLQEDAEQDRALVREWNAEPLNVRTLYAALVDVWPRTYGNRTSWSQPSIEMAAAIVGRYSALTSSTPEKP